MKTRSFFYFLLGAMALSAIGTSADASQLELPGGPILVGDRVEIRVVPPLPGLEIHAETRPGSQVARSSILDGAAPGGLVWTPGEAGLVRLRLIDESGEEIDRQDLAVRYRRRPVSAMVVLLAAGGLLFGGLAVSFSFLRR